MPTAQDVQGWIAEGLDCEHVDVYGPDGIHFEALVVSSLFDGLSRIKQHQLVYRTLGQRMESEIHALALKTMTPSEFSDRQ